MVYKYVECENILTVVTKSGNLFFINKLFTAKTGG